MNDTSITERLETAIDNISTSLRSKEIMKEAVTTIRELQEEVEDLSTVKIILGDEEVVLDKKISADVVQTALEDFMWRLLQVTQLQLRDNQITVGSYSYVKDSQGLWCLDQNTSIKVLSSEHADCIDAYYQLLTRGKTNE
jgi:hypothetical protein